MFTGIVEDIGRVTLVEDLGRVRSLTLEMPAGLTEIFPGDSINVNGACLTVVEKRGKAAKVDVSAETLQRTTFQWIREGEEVNVERALRLTDRLGGHIVTGHIDGVGIISEKQDEGDFSRFRLQVPQSVARYTVEKGSIAVDGVSLTVSECKDDWIRLTLIPFTLQRTTLFKKRVGDRVNVETDIVGKYIERLLNKGFLGGHGGPRDLVEERGISRGFLREYGFLEE